MRTKQKKTRNIIDPNYPLLSIKEIVSQILAEVADLPSEVENALTAARDASWNYFIKANEIAAKKRDSITKQQNNN